MYGARTDCLSVTQEPHKHAHYVSLLRALSYRPNSVKEEDAAAADSEPKVGEKRKADSSEEPDCAREVLEDMCRAFRGWVEGREWLNMRLGVSCPHYPDAWACQLMTQLQFFSLLPAAGLVLTASLMELYKSFLSVLSEVGGGGDRAERVVRSVGEGLLRVSYRNHSHDC